jgi:deoxyribodipyrimidine photo-lyase
MSRAMTDLTGLPSPAATRTEALARLSRFVPHAGRDYAARRNYDLPDAGHPHVSQLSPYLRHRLITEDEVLSAVLGRFSLKGAEKFVQEVCWRSYWKGWLEMRPAVWTSYRRNLDACLDSADAALAGRLAAAEEGRTGIDCFDAWARELVTTGYLHNHARMWFASIWIFTLRLPWAAGADFFLRNLLDGDPASNTLGWRWVAGLQTRGKHYIARASNIARYTEGRFSPEGLVTDAEPLEGPPHPERRPAPQGDTPTPGARTGVVLTEDDLSPGFVLDRLDAAPVAHAALVSVDRRSPRGAADHVRRFTHDAVEDARARWSDRLGGAGPIAADPKAIADWARAAHLQQVVTPYAPIGAAAEALDRLDASLAGDQIRLCRVMRDWDDAAWPHATHGFFRFKEKIPELIAGL